MKSSIAILGAFFVDLACRIDRMPVWGETIHGKHFSLGPGGKGSNQAVAAARQGACVELITRVGSDVFGEMALDLFEKERVGSRFVVVDDESTTGTATIIVDDANGENSIVIVPGACGRMTDSDVDAASGTIQSASFFVSQLELDLDVCLRGIELAHGANVRVILNPAPAIRLPPDTFPMVSYLTPNEIEASALAGVSVSTVPEAKVAAGILRDYGVDNVVITLGAEGAYVCGTGFEGLVPAFHVTKTIDTTGAGDAFNGGFAAALYKGASVKEATRFGNAVAGISVTRPGTAPSMPTKHEVEELLKVES